MQVKPIMQVWETILQTIPDTARPVLETFTVTGMADVNQIQEYNNLTRDRVARAVERMASGELLQEFSRPLPRPDQRGKPAAVFLLTEKGASVLRKLGHGHARPCGLQDDSALLHRLAMTDLHLAGFKAGQTILTDQEIQFNEDQRIRPDHQVRLKDGRRLILEIEQSASMDVLRRIVESLQNKQEFFASQSSAKYLPEVRMIVQLPRGTKWDRTLHVWSKAMEVVKEKSEKELGFRLFAIPRREFLVAPDWEAERKLLWVEVAPREKSTAIQLAAEAIPERVLYGSSHEQRLVLAALWQDFMENLQPTIQSFPEPEPEFFQIMGLIYAASHGAGLSALERARLPVASIYLLNEYLTMCDLRNRLNKALHSGKGDVRWNPTTIMHRMQVVINTFLAAHGWSSHGPLFVIANMSEWGRDESRTFGVKVRIHSAEIMMAKDDLVVPSSDELRNAEKALEWVLQALFEYSLELGLGRIEFW
jgi:hypothetical protein